MQYKSRTSAYGKKNSALTRNFDHFNPMVTVLRRKTSSKQGNSRLLTETRAYIPGGIGGMHPPPNIFRGG